jgi:4-amino-4-deoxy-L-arabinose transferase-like glycosyltransferase
LEEDFSGYRPKEGASAGCEGAVPASWLRRHFIPPLLVAVALILFFAGYPHLIKEARSQGFVLEELAPLMTLLVEWGKTSYWLGGRPLFVPMILTLAAALGMFLYCLVKKDLPLFLQNRLLLILALAFLIMYAIGGTRSFPLYIVGIITILFLGWLSGWKNKEDTSGPTSAGTNGKVLLAGFLLLGLLIRLYQVDIFPRLYLVDEQLFAQVALDLGKRPLEFFSEPHIMKPHLLRIASLRLAFSALGVGLFQQRTLSVLEGTLTILLVYLLCRKLWGHRAGLFAAFVLAVDPWSIGHSRIGVHNIEGPLFLALSLLLAIRAVERGGWRNFLLLGMAAGATIYLYLSCLIMAPYLFMMAVVGRYLRVRDRVSLIKEAGAMAAAAVVVALPYVTLGRENIRELDAFYSAGGDFLTSARHHGWHPTFALFVNSWSGIDFLVDWSARALHPARTMYPNPISIGFSLLGVGALLAMRKNFRNLLVLLWVPVAWLPVTLSYGFAERRLFATLAPIPAMLAGLWLAKLWGGKSEGLIDRLRRGLTVALLIPLLLVSMYIVYADADPTSGGSPHPRKAPEFIGALPPDYTVLISGSLETNPFLVYLASYDRLNGAEKQAFSFLSMEALEPMAEKLASTPRVAVVTDAGPAERRLLRRIKALNPNAKIFISSEYLACLTEQTGSVAEDP